VKSLLEATIAVVFVVFVVKLIEMILLLQMMIKRTRKLSTMELKENYWEEREEPYAEQHGWNWKCSALALFHHCHFHLSILEQTM
jgi:hypothetical protein